MFHLTPQERSVLFALVIVCLAGALVRFGLDIHARPLRWVNSAARPIPHAKADINKDDAAALDRIDGIGPKTAARIVAYRQKHGPFNSIDALSNVKGISKKALGKIKAYYAHKERDDE